MQRGHKRKKKASSTSPALADDAPRQVARPPRRNAPNDDAWAVVYYYRHADSTSPARDFVSSCPVQVRAEFRAVLDAVAKAPPTKFSGGGKWEAMRGEMRGIYEVRARHSQMLYRLFCVLDHAPNGENLLVILDGAAKRNRTVVSDAEYLRVQTYRDEYKATVPRSYR